MTNNTPDYNDNLYFEEKKMFETELEIKLAKRLNDVNNENHALLLENNKLKELLKECSPYISRSATSRMMKNSAGYKKDMKLLTKIDEVLK